jgi:hypothetical protein
MTAWRNSGMEKYWCLKIMNVSFEVAGIAKGYGLDGRGSIPSRGKNCSLLHRVQTGSEAHSASYKMGTGGFSPVVKRPGHEANHSPLSST